MFSWLANWMPLLLFTPEFILMSHFIMAMKKHHNHNNSEIVDIQVQWIAVGIFFMCFRNIGFRAFLVRCPFSSRHIRKTSGDIWKFFSAFLIPHIFRKSHKSHCHNFKWFRSNRAKSTPGGKIPPNCNIRVKWPYSISLPVCGLLFQHIYLGPYSRYCHIWSERDCLWPC